MEDRKIVGWYGVSIDCGNYIEILGHAICPRYEGETEQETKERFARERGGKVEHYIFW